MSVVKWFVVGGMSHDPERSVSGWTVRIKEIASRARN
jgi:hypothetical protein